MKKQVYLQCILVAFTAFALSGCGSSKSASAASAAASGIPSSNVQCGDQACVK